MTGREQPLVSIHVAMAQNGVIGRDGGLPWRLSTDLKRFKALTLGKPIVMGRRTWDSFPRRPLPDRENIVITRNAGFEDEGAVRVGSIDEAMRHAAGSGVDEICVIGGGEIFRETIDLAGILHVTHVLAQIDGDTVFPQITSRDWEVVSRDAVPEGERDSHATEYVIYRRR